MGWPLRVFVIIGLSIAIRVTWLARLRATVLALLLIPGPRFLSLGRLDQPAVGDRVGHTRLLRECLVVGLDGVLVTAGARQRIAAVVVGIGAGQRLPCIGGGGVVLAAVGVGAFAHALVPDLVRAALERAVVGRQRLLPRQAGTQQQRGDRKSTRLNSSH